METLREWFANFQTQTGDTPNHIIFAYSGFWEDDDDDGWDIERRVLIQFRDLPASILDKPFHAGFGGNSTPNLCAWSDSWVIFSDNYDGAEELRWVPRSPIEHNPIRPGGG